MRAVSQEKKSAILDAALSLFVKQGVGATTMEQVRLAVSVSNGTLFHFFPTKENLSAELYLHALKHRHARIIAFIEEQTQRRYAPKAGIYGVVKTHVDWMIANP